MIYGLMAAALVTSFIKPEYQELCRKAGEEYEVSAELLMSVIEHESSGMAEAVSEDGKCVGLCQLNTDYFSGDLMDPETNIEMAAEYLSGLIEYYESEELALMKYHGEWNAVQKYSEGIISDYAAGILERAAELENKDADSGDFGNCSNDIDQCDSASAGYEGEEPDVVPEGIQRGTTERTEDRDGRSNEEAGGEPGGCGFYVCGRFEGILTKDQGGNDSWDALDDSMPILSNISEHGWSMSSRCSVSAWKNYQFFLRFLNGG